MSCFAQYKNEAIVSVYESEEVENITLYKINVKISNVNWTVLHRYKDFDELHSKLVADHGVAKDLLPPKKAIRNKCPKFVEQRRERLDSYLKNVLSYLELTMPREFATFLNFQYYDIIFLLQNLAVKLFCEGDRLLERSNIFIFTPLELYAISERVKLPCSSFELADKKFHFSHILDFCTQLKSLHIKGSEENIGTSNIYPQKLSFSMTVFKSLTELLVLNFPMQNISNAGTLRDTLTILRVHRTNARKISDILLCDIIHKEIDNDTKLLKWKELVEGNFSSNSIEDIDSSIQLLPVIQKLTLNQNRISEISNLSSLPRLSHLSLCENLFTTCQDWHSKIGKIISINLSQNMITSLVGFSKLYSLESLDVSCNRITDIEEVQHICKLPCLENLRLTANPVASVVDYRVKVIEQFNVRMQDICLDNERPSEKELDTARVLQALRIVKEGKAPSFFNNNDHIFATVTAQGGSGL